VEGKAQEKPIMDTELRKILTECIRDIETGARDVEGCLQRHADRAAELRPHLELWTGLDAAEKAEPDIGSQQRGQHQLLTTLSEVERGGRKRMIPFLTPALVKAGAVAVAAVLVIGGTAGASAALGGPNVPGEVLSGIGINDTSGPDRHREMDREQEMERTSEGPGDPDEPIDNNPEAHREQEMERDREMERASEGPGDPDGPIDNNPEANREQEMESQQEMERTSEGPGEPNDSVDNNPEAHQEQEMESEQTMEGPFEGSGNANDPHRHASGPGPAY
jgi:hypothetical protein